VRTGVVAARGNLSPFNFRLEGRQGCLPQHSSPEGGLGALGVDHFGLDDHGLDELAREPASLDRRSYRAAKVPSAGTPGTSVAERDA
jgi:hypothetical protein